MSLILTRSPYFVNRGFLDEDATVKLEIGIYSGEEGLEVVETYALSFRNGYSIDISPLLNDYLGRSHTIVNGIYIFSISILKYLRITISGSLNGVAQSDSISEHHFTNGYLYSTDEYNFDFSSELRSIGYYTGSTNTVYRLINSDLRLRFLATDVVLTDNPNLENFRVLYYSKSELVYQEVSSIEYDNNISTQYFSSNFGRLDFEKRVLDSAGVYEENKCIDNFIEDFIKIEIDRVDIYLEDEFKKSIKVKIIDECKYKPYRVTFMNRYGVEEDLWFFKRSDIDINIKKEEFRGNSLYSYSSGDGVKTMNHFNVNGYEKVTLNSGFVEEEMNEAFKQLLLSEEVTLYDYKEKKTYNVNLGTSELQYKQHVNDKLINYTIEFEFAYEVINNVG